MILVEHFIHCTPLCFLAQGSNFPPQIRRLWYFLAPAIYFLLLLRGRVEGAEEIARGNSPSFLLLSNNDATRTRNKGKGGEGGKLLLSAAPLTKSSGTTLRRQKKEEKCCYNNNIIPFVWKKKVRTFLPALFPPTSQLSKKQEKFVSS